MATSKLETNLNVDDEDNDELQFRDTFPGFSDAPILNDEEHAKLLPSYDEEQPEKASFWTFKYYQNLFNVDTKQVIERIVWSAIPRPGGATYLHRFIRPNPDLYGPFWICVTLVFTIAVSNDIAEYLQSLGTEKSVTYYDYRKVTFTATTLFSYTFLLPLAIWGFLWYFESAAQLTILEIICIYGYSLAIYIPISILWIVKVFWLQVVLILLGFLLSASVMMLTFWPAVRETRRKISAVLLLVICLFHIMLCFGFSVYFFQPQHVADEKVISAVTVPKALESPPHIASSKHEDNEDNSDTNPPAQTKNLESANLVMKSQNDSVTAMLNNDERNSNITYLEEKVLHNTSENNNSKSNAILPLVNTKKSNNYKQETEMNTLTSQLKNNKGFKTLLNKNKAIGADIHDAQKS